MEDSQIAVKNMSPLEALRKAIEDAGGQTALAKLLGTGQSTVSWWLKKGHVTDPIFVLKIEVELGVSRHDLRPDIYPRDEQVAA